MSTKLDWRKYGFNPRELEKVAWNQVQKVLGLPFKKAVRVVPAAGAVYDLENNTIYVDVMVKHNSREYLNAIIHELIHKIGVENNKEWAADEDKVFLYQDLVYYSLAKGLHDKLLISPKI